MAESVVSCAVQTIGKLLIDEAKFLWDMEGKVMDLQNELKLIQCLLRDADTKQEHDQTVREWVAQLRDVAYDAEDVIEQYILRVAPKGGQNIIKAYACFMAECTCVRAYVVGTEIEGLKSRISGIGNMMQKYGIQPLNEGERKCEGTSTPKRTYAHFEGEDFVGREDSIERLVKELKDGKHRVVSIWGMGGLGKTTLVRKVFTHDEVKNHFHGFAWACISQKYDVRYILEGILVNLIPNQGEEVTKMRNDKLLETLYLTQKEKRCIVVLDDIWTKQAWDDLRAAFPIKDTRSKLLITTRNKEVAEHIDSHCFLHEPQCLSHKESWVLLKKRAFPKTEEITKDMEKLGDELLKKCGGLPLAIIMLGGLLAHNKWETIHRKINVYFSDKNDALKVLAFSYDDLPWYLKSCFLYLGSFPEDAKIPTKRVLHMWIAEGFVPPIDDEEKGITMEDEAEQYLMELVNRGLVQAQLNLNGDIKSFRLHDLMRDLCVSKAKQEKFLSFHNIQRDNEREGSSSSMAREDETTCRTRRLSLSGEGNATLRVDQIRRTMRCVRTFLFFQSGKSNRGIWEQFQPIFINCTFLRVLKLENLFRVEENLPKSVGDLIHLRFLSLARSKFKGLPQSMGNLVCMEFLDLRSSTKVVSIPNVFWKMRRLRYLCLPYKFDVKEKFHDGRKKLQLNTLKNLRTLKNFSPQKCDVNNVGKLTNLRELTIFDLNEPNKLEIFPQLVKFKLKHFRSLSYLGESRHLWTEDELNKMSNYNHLRKLSLRGKIEKLPKCESLPQQLRKLVLLFSELKEDPMPILEKLPHLVFLMLADYSFMGKEMVCSAGGFPQLKHLLFWRLYDLEEWRVAEGAMPRLSRLGIGLCFRLRAVPSLETCDYHCLKEIKRDINVINRSRVLHTKSTQSVTPNYELLYIPNRYITTSSQSMLVARIIHRYEC